MKKTFFIVLVIFLFFPALTQAHPGRTDSSGCHTCRTNCAKWGLSSGEYHCHQAKSLPQPKEPIKSHYSDNGGYTTLASEYKQPKIDKAIKPVNAKLDNNIQKNSNIKVTEPINESKPSKSWFSRIWSWLIK
ncbi:MAG: Membrane protein [Parcubacteria group bacterium GW2011_GWC2_39_14]|nr:MAG: Membrane protein [Parcubacteria group bacterium GW2011_GWC2_39_14]KKR55549.1 MAG: Membrane protein [Parcubacteria group bacterium GW2011_GWA2_40_23]